MLRLEGGAIVTVDAADYATIPMRFCFNGTRARAVCESERIAIEFPDGRSERLTSGPQRPSMDVAVGEIVDWLDGKVPFTSDAQEAVDTLETIVAFHASHRRGAAWTALPLRGTDREIAVNSG